MNEKVRKIIGVIVALLGFIELYMAIREGGVSAILIGIGLLVIAALSFMKRKK